VTQDSWAGGGGGLFADFVSGEAKKVGRTNPWGKRIEQEE